MIFYSGGEKMADRESHLHLSYELHFCLLHLFLLKTLPDLHLFVAVILFLSLHPFSPLPLSYGSLAGHLHGVGDCADPLRAVGVGAGPGAGSVHGAGAGQGGRPGSGQAGHTGRGHWEEGEGGQKAFSITFL